MQHKKIASILAIAVLSLAVPLFTVPRANAFHSSITFPTNPTGGTLFVNRFDAYHDATVDAARENSPVTFNVLIRTDSAVGQRNITVGVKFEWMTSWINASDAGPANTLEVAPDSYATATVSVTMPALTGQFVGYNLYLHEWEVRVWSGAANAPSGATCDSDGTLTGCQTSPLRTAFAIYSNDQADGINAMEEASAKIDSLSIPFGFPGTAKATADRSQATAELALGDTFYDDGNFAMAKTRYQNALNLANSAINALSGGDAATYTNVLLGGIGSFLLGVGVFIAGFGGFWYVIRRRKA